MRIDPPSTGPELDQLCAFLDYYRETLLLKTDGLSSAELARPLPPSTLTLAGLLNHLARVEDTWFRVRFAGLPEDEAWAGVDWTADPDHEFRRAPELEPEQLRRRCRHACARSREVVRRATGPDQLSVVPRRDEGPFDLRWMMLHMIEETERHAGHADLLREAIDGAVGE